MHACILMYPCPPVSPSSIGAQQAFSHASIRLTSNPMPGHRCFCAHRCAHPASHPASHPPTIHSIRAGRSKKVQRQVFFERKPTIPSSNSRVYRPKQRGPAPATAVPRDPIRHDTTLHGTAIGYADQARPSQYYHPCLYGFMCQSGHVREM